MADAKKRRTPRGGLPLTEQRSTFLDQLRSDAGALEGLSRWIHREVRPDVPDAVLISAVFDAGVNAIQQSSEERSYAEEAASDEFQRERAALRRRPRGIGTDG